MAWESQFDLPYSVELWDDSDSHIEELIALPVITGLRGLHSMRL